MSKEDLFSVPSEERDRHTAHQTVKRVKTNHEMNRQFHVDNTRFDLQFAHIYFSRLKQIRRNVMETARRKWSHGEDGCEVIDKIIQLQLGTTCVIVGTLFKQVVMRNDVIKQYSAMRGLPSQNFASSMLSDGDGLIIEDDSGRARLSGSDRYPLDPAMFVTGTVVALKGREKSDGDFEVDEILFPGFAPHAGEAIPSPLTRKNNNPGNDSYVALVSGISIGSEKTSLIQTQLLSHVLTGLAGGDVEMQIQGRVQRVIFVGNSVHIAEQEKTLGKQTFQQKTRIRTQVMEPMQELDIFLAQVAGSVDVDVMPGESDPASRALPQQPLHHCLFPLASRLKTFHSTTNPYLSTINNGEVTILGTSGQSVDDVLRYSKISDRLDVLHLMLRWQHLAPTAPDTLTCFPFGDCDPFVITSTPHVFFTGNATEFQTRLVSDPEQANSSSSSSSSSIPPPRSVRLIAVPSFASTGVIVLLNLATLECHPLTLRIK